MAAPSSFFNQSARQSPTDPDLRIRDERVEALKAVVGKLAHDFNNFLVPQFGYLTLISEELPAETPAAHYLKTAENAARTTEGYIESILLAVRPQRQYAPKDFDLGSVLAEMTEHWRKEIPASVGIHLHQEIEPAPFHGDERHWRKLIEHLLANARYAIATGGTLRLSLAPAILEPAAAARLGIENPSIYRLEIEDSGFGIPAELHGRVFEPFFTTRPQTRGSGLGMTIVHTVTHFHGGQVELHSALDKGTRLTLSIPRTPPVLARSAAGGLLRQRPAKRRKVLLVEDDPFIKEVLKNWFSAHEFDTHIVETPVDTAKFLNRDAAACSLVLTEAVLKNGRGEEVYEITRKIEGLTCVFLSSPEAPAPPEGTVALQKPLTFGALLDTVRAYAR